LLAAEELEGGLFLLGELAAEQTAELLGGRNGYGVEGEEDVVGLQSGAGKALALGDGLEPHPLGMGQHLNARLHRLEEAHIVERNCLFLLDETVLRFSPS